jgi:hypothetical protein
MIQSVSWLDPGQEYLPPLLRLLLEKADWRLMMEQRLMMVE